MKEEWRIEKLLTAGKPWLSVDIQSDDGWVSVAVEQDPLEEVEDLLCRVAMAIAVERSKLGAQ